MKIQELLDELQDIAENTCDPHASDAIRALMSAIHSKGISAEE